MDYWTPYQIGFKMDRRNMSFRIYIFPVYGIFFTSRVLIYRSLCQCLRSLMITWMSDEGKFVVSDPCVPRISMDKLLNINAGLSPCIKHCTIVYMPDQAREARSSCSTCECNMRVLWAGSVPYLLWSADRLLIHPNMMQITQPFELYLAVSPHLPKSAAVSAANSVARWVQKEESRLFLRNAPTF